MSDQSWYAITAKGDTEAEVSIHDEIGGWGITAQQFVKDIKAISAKTLHVRMNTPGGEIFDGTAIYNALVEHPARVVMHIDGLAASAGSFIAMAGDEVRMADNAYMMIHNGSGGVMGGAEDMRKYADLLDKCNDNIAGMYEKKTGKPRKHWRDLMDSETWFTADEAQAEGLADVVEPATKKAGASAGGRLKLYNKVPAAVHAMFAAPIQVNNSPEAAPRGDASTANSQLEQSMSETLAPAATPATTSAAGTVALTSQSTPQAEIARYNEQTRQTLIENGKKLGVEEGRNLEMGRMQKLIEAAPGRPDLVIQAFVTNQDPGSLTLAFKAAHEASAAAAVAQQAKDVEIARLNALLATGGHGGIPMSLSQAKSEQYVEMEPETRAKMEWDSTPAIRAQFSDNYTRYKLWRVNELKGNVRVLRTA